MSEKVVFASQEVTLHTSQGTYKTAFGADQHVVESVTLVPGDTVELDKLPDYQQEAVKEGKVPGVEVMSKSEAEKKSEEVARLRAFVEQQSAGGTPSFVFPGLSGPDADDGSFSDHLVPDSVRRENHAARGEEEAGSAEAPSRPGRATRRVEGAPAAEGKEAAEDK